MDIGDLTNTLVKRKVEPQDVGFCIGAFTCESEDITNRCFSKYEQLRHAVTGLNVYNDIHNTMLQPSIN